MTREVRHLHYEVIAGFRRTGEILQRLPDPMLPAMLNKVGMSTDHARICIELHHLWHGYNWERYEPVDRWWCETGHSSPKTPIEAITMLHGWRHAVQH